VTLPAYLHVSRLLPEAALPRRSADDVGFDLTAAESLVLPPSNSLRVRTGIAIALPTQTAGFIVPRSGLAANEGVTVLNAPGLIDPGYTGSCDVLLYNTSGRPVCIEAGQRVAQLVLVPVWLPEIVEVQTLGQAKRGARGFGSTGR